MSIAENLDLEQIARPRTAHVHRSGQGVHPRQVHAAQLIHVTGVVKLVVVVARRLQDHLLARTPESSSGAAPCRQDRLALTM
jgi:hypothetical protein